MLDFCDGANIPQYLYSWRRHPESISSVHRGPQHEQRVLLSTRYIKSRIQRLQKNDRQKDELAYSYFSLGTIHYHEREIPECRENLLMAIRLDPFVAVKAYWYLGLSLINKGLADRIRNFRDFLLSSKTP